MILHLQKISLASDGTTSHSTRLENNASQVAGYVVAAAISAFSPYIPNISHLSPGLQAHPRIIHTVFPSQQVKIEKNIFTLWSTS